MAADEIQSPECPLYQDKQLLLVLTRKIKYLFWPNLIYNIVFSQASSRPHERWYQPKYMAPLYRTDTDSILDSSDGGFLDLMQCMAFYGMYTD
jgi:hypothetical protein